MYIVDALFTLKHNHLVELSQISYFINQIVEQWRYNGQIIGREIPLYLEQLDKTHGLVVRLICPEQQSLNSKYNNDLVNQSLFQAQQADVFF